MIRYYALFAVLALMGGCQSMVFVAADASAGSSYGSSLEGEMLTEFEVGENFSSLDELLLLLRRNVNHSFEQCGLESAYFIPDVSRQWGTLLFTYRYTPWKLGVQFVRSPEGTGRVAAIVRVVGTTNENSPDPGRLRPAVSQIYQGLKLAGNPQYLLMEAQPGVANDEKGD